VIDPLNRTHAVDENRPTEMTRVMDGVADLAYGLGIAVLAIHHLGKPSAERRGDPWDRFRGASSIRSGSDANLMLDPSGDRILCAALTGYLALLQLGAAQTLAALGLDQGDLQTYAAWNGIAAVVTVVFGVRLLQRPTRGTLNWSIAWGILSVIGGVTQIGSGASNDVFIGSIVAAGVAGALSYAARGVAPETKGVEAPSAVRPTALPTPTPVSAPAIPAASLAPPVVAPKSSVADSEVIGANDAIAPINLGVALVFGLLLPLSVSVLPTTPRPTRSLRLAEAA